MEVSSDRPGFLFWVSNLTINLDPEEFVMKSRDLACVMVLFGCLLAPSISHALPVLYSASGFVLDHYQNPLAIEGWVTFSDQLRDWSDGQPVEPDDEYSGLYVYRYNITGFSLMVGDYLFAGYDGSLFMPLVQNYPSTGDWGISDLMWFLDGDTGSQWTNWTGEHFYFYNADGTPKDYSQYVELADQIQLTDRMYMENDPILPDPRGPAEFNLLLARQGPAPVPEPGTMVLVGVGILWMFSRKARYKER